MATRPARKGAEGFESFYASVYGGRWPALRAALLSPVRQVARRNAFVGSDASGPDCQRAHLAATKMAGCDVLVLEPGQRFRDDSSVGLRAFYIMDPASMYAAKALVTASSSEGARDPDERILDLCAAPGGKSLILAEALGAEGRLTCNEMSDRRRARLRAVLEDYLPREVLSRVEVTGHDGAKWCLYESDAYDRILIDAPCSGERHLLENSDELKLWSPARSKNLAVRQYALLASAHAVLKTGGIMVYSTCSISTMENDAVVARLLKKRGQSVRVIPVADVFANEPEALIGEATENGQMILPDTTGFGPIYFSVLEKTALP